jgi:hypothetical protein
MLATAPPARQLRIFAGKARTVAPTPATTTPLIRRHPQVAPDHDRVGADIETVI